jgi:hypothetical protein
LTTYIFKKLLTKIDIGMQMEQNSLRKNTWDLWFQICCNKIWAT